MTGKKVVIVAHVDVDGVISAALLMQSFQLPFKETKIVFAHPYTVDKIVIPKSAKRVFVVDIAVSTRNPEMTKAFINRLGKRLVRWYDHHIGWTTEITGDNPAFIIGKTGSCAELIGGDSSLVADAIAIDTRRGEPSNRVEMLEKALKAHLDDNNIRLLAVKWLLSGDEVMERALNKAAKKYAGIQAETDQLAETYKISGNVAQVDARNSKRSYDLTQLLLVGQRRAQFAVALTKTSRGEEKIAISTFCKDVNLVKLFELPSGASFRIHLPASQFSVSEILKKLQSVVL